MLTGLKDRLQKVGFRVDLVPVRFTNYCMIEMCGHEVFRCNLKHLKFNTSYDRDPVCRRGVDAVITSAVKFRRGRACLWFWTLLNHQMFRRNQYEPIDYWPVDVDVTAFSGVSKCIECCNILVRDDVKKEEEEKPETYFKL
ncbi:hypothetical protein PYW07_015130 [Mythimna separata]|uniref:Uncharacterized protein n=1 Tax=Mythimna separata TaxID=271217 RepID=A0AAD7YYX0_MYTSE|nr:hypothetical protein PYW07_015130 [Mythimna separata]